MPTVESVISGYLKLRRKKESIEAEAKERAAEVKEKMVYLEKWLKDKADQDGVSSFKTGSGTAFLTTTDFATVADWYAVLGFVKENEAFEMLEKRVSKNAVREHIEAHSAVPPGVNYGTKLNINIRKPTLKGE